MKLGYSNHFWRRQSRPPRAKFPGEDSGLATSILWTFKSAFCHLAHRFKVISSSLFLQELRYLSIIRLLVLNVSMILVYMFVYSTNISKNRGKNGYTSSERHLYDGHCRSKQYKRQKLMTRCFEEAKVR